MKKAKEGDTVHVHYRGRFEDGRVFGSSLDRGPIEFTLGEGEVIPGVDEVIRGMEIGEKTSATVTPDQGYGPRRPELILKVARERFPGQKVPGLGDRFELRGENGKPVTVTVRRVEDDTVEVDANHPLAGHELHFDLQLVGIAG